ncbi:cysteine-rich receptor-like protein kinase 44 isoform X1 [Cannabis sativa]|uniref:cysteine-rich receptor-like protein kinase 44 isoform X1 n=1 Tax=Cannabis sativa TaxID=3483 RepID=UPI0029C9FD31|nr:cysteine-rich receptor-like protein kinase 44 isoform X1 [Cannabis sativa]
MAKISLLSFLLCNIFLLVAQQTTAQPPSFLFQFCLNDKGNYTLNSTYQANLNHLLTTLPTSQNDNGYGFYNVSYGKGSDQVYAVGLCRGDATPNVCRSCLNDSMHVLTDICPNQKEAVGWYDNCMLRYSNSSTLRYSNRSMLGTPVTIPLNYLWNPENVSSSNVQEYFDDLRTLLDGLKNEAASGGSLRKYATGQTKAPDFLTIYALVQCTPDLPQQQCINCLDYVYSRIPNCCFGKVGGRVVGPTCSVRYEKYLFYGSPYDPRPPSQKAPTPAPTNNTINNITEGQKSTDKSRNIIIAVVATVSGVVLIIFFLVCLRLRKSKKNVQAIKTYEPVDEIESAESLLYDFETINVATDQFSEDNKLGQGGFGAVYQGRLANGQDIAVKRLCRGSGQGDLEFKNEVMLVAKLQHRNLVRLLGFSLESSERLLVYEFVQNASLDHFIFDPRNRVTLDWDRRYKIIGGVARGLLYLHEDSRLRIIHRDLKASNILLDEEMNPKIADFGMARLFVVDQTQGNTSRIVGTYGYMAPEYAMHGHFSVKSDVFSFGVLILEIVSGQKNNSFRQGEYVEDLLSYTWRIYREGNTSKMVDPLMRVGSASEVMRCIHIGLLCVQENIENRPTMNAIVPMLNSNSLSLPLPSEPAFFMRSNTGSHMSFGSDFNSRETTKSSNHPKNDCINEASITELFPR